MDPENLAPAVMRRRRKVARQQREQTPEAPKLGERKYSDEENGSNNAKLEFPHEEPQHSSYAQPLLTQQQSKLQHSVSMKSEKQKTEPSSMTKTIGGHLSKILSRRDKKISTSNVRSLSSPRAEIINGKSDVFVLMKQARRSLSSPRHKEESNEINSKSPNPPPVPERNISVNKSSLLNSNNDNKVLTPFERNIQRFEEERRRFELEKQRFEYEKRELDTMRKNRMEEFDRKRILSSYAHHIRPNDNMVMVTNKQPLPPTNEEQKLELIQSFEVAQKISSQIINDEIIQKKNSLSSLQSRRSDYESSTCDSCDDSDEAEYSSSPISQQIKTVDDFVEKIEENESKNVLSEISKDTKTIDNEVNLSGSLEKIKDVQTMDTDVFSPKIQELADIKPEVLDEKANQSLESKPIENETKTIELKNLCNSLEEKKLINSNVSSKKFYNNFKSGFIEAKITWKQFRKDHPEEWQTIKYLWNKCFSGLIILTIYCGLGGMIFRFTEGAFENIYKCGVKRVKRDFVDQLWLSSHNMREDDWKSLARLRLRKFEEELQIANEAGISSYSGQKSWTFLNGVIYCMTIVTTIGYGHISPSTNTGRAITIVYAIIGIPMFLILLADFGKLFTRCIKFVWAFVRRLYYTGSCRKVRKTAQVQEMMRGLNVMYDYATFRRPSMIAREAELNLEAGERNPSTSLSNPSTSLSNPSLGANLATPIRIDTPTTPAPEVFEIDDEFNLPISVAFVVLVIYILIGATIYCLWEDDWTFFESFYFVFISMSTIGFGDYVPTHPIYMMGTIVYLLFGLALTSMCINVVQVKLSDQFRQASAKIGATIGLKMAEEEASKASLTPTPVDLASVHHTITPLQIDNSREFEFSTPPTHPNSPASEPVILNNNYTKNKKEKKDKKDKKEKKSKK